ncbi:hypothetical protein NQ315_002850 [Exocentrus adspersus]|uniref:DUF3800 domain-containing protein n=1 Tax=Exocentrus adspersus TaxID=1586481 RepID=A0AAV8V6M8_9CUCU|nr:hypothetical protein NQ315_002850 [Exocentrus adspersus]
MKYIVYMDENGDAEGNYTLIARKPLPNKENEYGLFPVGVFALRRTDSRLPLYFFQKTAFVRICPIVRHVRTSSRTNKRPYI